MLLQLNCAAVGAVRNSFSDSLSLPALCAVTFHALPDTSLHKNDVKGYINELEASVSSAWKALIFRFWLFLREASFTNACHLHSTVEMEEINRGTSSHFRLDIGPLIITIEATINQGVALYGCFEVKRDKGKLVRVASVRPKLIEANQRKSSNFHFVFSLLRHEASEPLVKGR